MSTIARSTDLRVRKDVVRDSTKSKEDLETGTLKAKTLNLSDIPTSATGLVAGDVWSNGGVLTIV